MGRLRDGYEGLYACWGCDFVVDPCGSQVRGMVLEAEPVPVPYLPQPVPLEPRRRGIGCGAVGAYLRAGPYSRP